VTTLRVEESEYYIGGDWRGAEGESKGVNKQKIVVIIIKGESGWGVSTGWERVEYGRREREREREKERERKRERERERESQGK
jgi:hypothetical protein